jgi:hypothetical protein
MSSFRRPLKRPGVARLDTAAAGKTLCLPDEEKPTEGEDLADALVPMVPGEHPA